MLFCEFMSKSNTHSLCGDAAGSMEAVEILQVKNPYLNLKKVQ